MIIIIIYTYWHLVCLVPIHTVYMTMLELVFNHHVKYWLLSESQPRHSLLSLLVGITSYQVFSWTHLKPMCVVSNCSYVNNLCITTCCQKVFLCLNETWVIMNCTNFVNHCMLLAIQVKWSAVLSLHSLFVACSRAVGFLSAFYLSFLYHLKAGAHQANNQLSEHIYRFWSI